MYAKVLLKRKKLIMVVAERKINLQNSPIYNISMCSLENFHTCFLKWLGENYPRQFLNVLLNINIPKDVNVKFETQVRYSKDTILDLQITLNNGQDTEFIVIENKLKSYPTQEQLIKYQNYFRDNKSNFILLSLVPNFEVPKGWQYISYENLAEKLSHILEFKNQYDEFLITDYINVVKLIANAFPKLSTQKYDLYENNKLDEIGLKDIYIKYRTSELCNFINKNTNLSVTVDFRDKQGIINVWCSFENYNITFLIQIQNNEYRYCLIYGNESENELRESIATILTKNNIWFNNCIENYPKARNYQSKKFCGYKPNFIYRYQTLEKVFGKIKMSDISYKEIAEKVNKDISDLLKHKSEIVKILVDI